MKDIVNYFQILLNDTSNPCMLIDNENYDVVFTNYSMQKIINETGYLFNDNTNAKCYKILHNIDVPCENCNIHDTQPNEFYQFSLNIKNLNKTYRVSNTLIEFEGKKYNLNKFFITTSYINHELNFSLAIEKSIEIFFENNPYEMSSSYLELLGDFYQGQKAYIYYLNTAKTNMRKHYQWVVNSEYVVPNEITSKLPLNIFMSWLKTCDENDIIDLNNYDTNIALTKLEENILSSFEVDAITVSVIKNKNNEITGFIGVSNRSPSKFDYRLMKSTTNFICEKFSKKYIKNELRLMCDYDLLTGFLSRASYTNQLKIYEHTTPKNMGVIFANINGLRKTNDFFGAAEGDKLIKKCANILKNYFSDPFYRISGGEFICFCPDCEEKDFLKRVDTLREYLKISDDHIFAVGQAWKKTNYNIQKLISEASIVMYINKQNYYHNVTNQTEDIQDNTLKDLLSYLSNDEFMVYLQPQFDLTTNEVIGAEALIRRFDKTNNKMVFPDQFISLYEQKSVIRHVDIFVIEQVCSLLSDWIKLGKNMAISVNLSRVTLMEYDIVNTITNICDKYNIPHELVVIEVTERVGLIENEVASTLIDEFKENGFKISLDDFGCAYSNIVTLANIQVDEVKVDKSLVDNLLTNKKNEVIVKNVIDMCNNLGDSHTLAEGIETQEQADMLRKLNCKYGQGYLYSRPLPINEFYEKYISN